MRWFENRVKQRLDYTDYVVRQKARPTIGTCGVFSLGYGAKEVVQVFVMMMLRQCEVELAIAGQEEGKMGLSMLLAE